MKKNKLIYLIIVLVLALSISACKKESEVVEEDPVTPPVTQPAEEVEEDEKA